MDPTHTLRRRLAAARAQQLRWLADADPTLTLLAKALDTEQAIATMTLPELAAYVRTLPARARQEDRPCR